MNNAPAEHPIYAVRYTADHQKEWDDFVRTSKNGTFLLYRQYMDYHADRFADCSLLFYKGNRLTGLLPAHLKDGVLCSHGGLTFGGLVTDRTVSIHMVMQMFYALRMYAEANTQATRLIYRPAPSIYHSYPAEEDLYALFRYGATISQRFITSVIRQDRPQPFSTLRQRKLKRAQKGGLTVKESTDFAPFWDVLEHNLQERHRTNPVHTLQEITLLANRFPQHIRQFCVYNAQGEVIAGTVMYLYRQVAHVQYIGSTAEGRSLGALELLFHHLIPLFSTDYPYFDFGTSVEDGGHYLNEGLIFQKEGFGARAIVYDTYEVDLNAIHND